MELITVEIIAIGSKLRISTSKHGTTHGDQISWWKEEAVLLKLTRHRKMRIKKIYVVLLISEGVIKEHAEQLEECKMDEIQQKIIVQYKNYYCYRLESQRTKG